ncbi:MAG: ABC transporter permease [Candidatus Dormibacteraeota bacterium]|nr:ABC transporter permease [Candidatus Dormibacteraeota bacterium]
MSNQTSLAARPRLQLVLTSLLRADFLVLIRNPRGLVLSFILPLFILLVTASGKGTVRLGGLLILIGLAITLGLLSLSIIGYALNMARDREQGVFQRLRVTPAPTWTIMGSRLATQMVANLAIALVVVIVASVVHHLALSLAQYVLVLLVSLLGGAVFLSIGQALVGLLRSADTINAAGRVLLIALMFLGIFAQSGLLGATWESIARWTPVGAVMTLFAGVLNLNSWTSSDVLSVVACLGYIVVCTAIGIRWFQWEAR